MSLLSVYCAVDRKINYLSPNDASEFFSEFKKSCFTNNFSCTIKLENISQNKLNRDSLICDLMCNRSNKNEFTLTTLEQTINFSKTNREVDSQKIFDCYEVIYSDITLSFLDTNNPIYAGNKRISGRPTQIFQININDKPFDYINIAIDQDFMILLSADYYKNNKIVHQIKVNGFKKIDNIWAIGSIDIKNLKTHYKSRVNFDNFRFF